MAPRKKKKKKGKLLQLGEYSAVWLLISSVRAMPMRWVRGIADRLGGLLFALARERRGIAVENVRQALGAQQDGAEVRRIARESCTSFVLTLVESIKLRDDLIDPARLQRLASETESIERLLQRVKEIHDRARGCIFVTPHLGNWEVLPHVCAYLGIPLVVVARPLDNPYLERLVYRNRTASGQVLVPKRNAMFQLQKTLHQGKSIGLLADQSTGKGISVPFFGREAMTTPVPAILATAYRRPIVVVACCRSAGGDGFEGFMADPIWPGDYQSEKAEIVRLTTAMNRAMEAIVRQRPEQYFWLHNRWKKFRYRRGLRLR